MSMFDSRRFLEGLLSRYGRFPFCMIVFVMLMGIVGIGYVFFIKPLHAECALYRATINHVQDLERKFGVSLNTIALDGGVGGDTPVQIQDDHSIVDRALDYGLVVESTVHTHQNGKDVQTLQLQGSFEQCMKFFACNHDLEHLMLQATQQGVRARLTLGHGLRKESNI